MSVVRLREFQAVGAPGDGGGFAGLEFFQAVGGEDLEGLGVAGGGGGGIGIVALVGASARTGWVQRARSWRHLRRRWPGRRFGVEVVVDAVVGGGGVAQEAIGAGGVGEEGVGGLGVAVEADFVEPVGAVGVGAGLPEGDLAGSGGVEVVVVAEEGDLAGGVDVQGVAGVDLDDVIFDLDVGGVGGDADAVAEGLVDGVVESRIVPPVPA